MEVHEKWSILLCNDCHWNEKTSYAYAIFSLVLWVMLWCIGCFHLYFSCSVQGLILCAEALKLERRWWFQDERSTCSALVYYGSVALGLYHAAPPVWQKVLHRSCTYFSVTLLFPSDCCKSVVLSILRKLVSLNCCGDYCLKILSRAF